MRGDGGDAWPEIVVAVLVCTKVEKDNWSSVCETEAAESRLCGWITL